MKDIRRGFGASDKSLVTWGAIGMMWSAVSSAQMSGGGAGAAPSAEQSPDLQEIVVTALRRDTELQKTPVSVAAVSADTLDQRGAYDFIDFAASVPGFTILDLGPGERRPIIRGIESPGEPEVGIYYDEFQISSPPGATNDAGRFTPDIKLIDVQQVQVLRGPQGTLFGAGSEGGTVQTIFNKPNLSAFSGGFDGDVGGVEHGTENVMVDGFVNLPVISDVLGVRLVGYQVDTGGYIDNTALQTNDINHGRTQGGRVAVRYVPTGNLTIDVLALYNREHFDAGNEANAGLGNLVSTNPIYDPFDDMVHLYGLTGRYTFELATLTVDASVLRRSLEYVFPLDGLPIPWSDAAAQGLAPFVAGDATVGNAPVLQPQSTSAETYELRLNAPDAKDAFQWTVGGFLQDRSSVASSVVAFAGADGQVASAYPLFQNRITNNTLNQRAGYGDLSYTLFDKLTAAVGGRYETFDTSTYNRFLVNLGGASGTDVSAGSSYSSSKFVKKFNLAYQVTDDVMGYATYSEGFRAGGANQSNPTETMIPAGYKPDFVKNYEAGLKTRWFNKALTVNADYYYMNWQDIQVKGVTPDGLVDYLTNAGQAKVNGVELEVNARPAEQLSLGLTYGYTFARLTANEPPGQTESGFAGDRLPFVPRDELNLSADFTQPLPNGLALRYYLDYQYVGTSQNLFSSYLANPSTGAITSTPDPGFYNLPSYSLINARVSLQSGGWTTALYVNNLTNKRAETNDYWNPPFTPPAPGFISYSMPRVIGVKLSTRF